jgi:hypothetical protein
MSPRRRPEGLSENLPNPSPQRQQGTFLELALIETKESRRFVLREFARIAILSRSNCRGPCSWTGTFGHPLRPTRDPLAPSAQERTHDRYPTPRWHSGPTP